MEIAENNKQCATNIPLNYFNKSKEFVQWTPIPNTDNKKRMNFLSF